MRKQKLQLLRLIQMLLLTVYLLSVVTGDYSSSIQKFFQSIIFLVAMLMNFIPEKKQQYEPVFFKYYWLDVVVELLLIFLLTFLVLLILK